ncbi:hypothetical protein OQA88_3588 [Cercophora sp. LCS_1]
MDDQSRKRVLINGSDDFIDYHTQERTDPVVGAFFDMHAYYRGDEQMDTIGGSDTSENTPPLTSASSDMAGQDLDDEDIVMPDAPPEPHRDQVLLGMAPAPNYSPRYPTIFHDPEDLTPLPESSSFPMLRPPSPGCPILLPQSPKPQTPGHHLPLSPSRPLETPRQPARKVNAEHTNRVRQIGACMACKINRVGCSHEGDICKGCKKKCEKMPKSAAMYIHKLCGRQTPKNIAGTGLNRWPCPSMAPMPSHSQFDPGKCMDVTVSFEVTGHRLQLPANKFDIGNGQQRWGIEPGLPVDDMIYNWALQQLLSEDPSRDFQSAMNKLLAVCVQERILGPAVHLSSSGFSDGSSNLVKPLRSCLDKLLRIVCMRGLMRWEFVVRSTYTGSRGDTLDFQAVKGFLRHHAVGIISQCEKDALQEIDKLVAPSDIREKEQHLLWSSVNVATWVSLWHLILLYREILIELESPSHAQARTRPGGEDQRAKFKETTEELYDVVVVLYSNLFKTKKTLQDIKNARDGLFAGNVALQGAFDMAWRAHSVFYGSFETKIPGDELVKAFIISKEEAVLKRK